MPTAFARHVAVRQAFGAHIKKRRVRVPPQRQPNAERLAYAQSLLGVMGAAIGFVREHLYPELPALVQEAGVVHDAPGRTYADKVQALVNKAAHAMFKEFPQERIRALARKAAGRVSKAQREALKKQLHAVFGQEIAIDVLSEKGIGDRLDVWADENAHLIKKVSSDFFDEVASRTVRSLRKGKRADELADEIQQRLGVSESRARLIARDQIGKLNGELNKARQQNLGVDKFIWRTSEDERVRPEHEVLDGEEFKWSDPPSEGIPGEPINCRCIAEPVLDELFDAL